MAVLAAEGRLIHYRLEAAARGADGPTLALIDPLGADFRIWDPTTPHLTPGRPLLRHDKRGHGLSAAPAGGWRIEDYAADLALLLDHLQLKRVDLVGLSIGGLIALALIDARPDLVGRLALLDTGAAIGTTELWMERAALAEAEGMESVAAATRERWFTPASRAARPDLALYELMVARQPVAGYAAACRALADADVTSAARRVAVPSLCVVGAEDGSTPPETMRELASLIPHARYEEIAACGHIPCVERPEALAALLNAHFA